MNLIISIPTSILSDFEDFFNDLKRLAKSWKLDFKDIRRCTRKLAQLLRKIELLNEDLLVRLNG